MNPFRQCFSVDRDASITGQLTFNGRTYRPLNNTGYILKAGLSYTVIVDDSSMTYEMDTRGIQKCSFPGCSNARQSKGSRPGGALFGDTKFRHKWCKYHRHGAGKAARLALSGSPV